MTEQSTNPWPNPSSDSPPVTQDQLNSKVLHMITLQNSSLATLGACLAELNSSISNKVVSQALSDAVNDQLKMVQAYEALVILHTKLKQQNKCTKQSLS